MKGDFIELREDVSSSPLFSEDLAPVPKEKRTWRMWDLVAIWVGMAVCIPTYLLASYMIKSGLSWQAALIIIGLANLIITIPMVLNGHAGVKYGIPFPVLGRAAFGTIGIHLASLLRGLVACGWFGIQTWIGGLAFYAIWNVITGTAPSLELDTGKFMGFAAFWLVNIFFIWKGTESIRWLEDFAAPILILMGVALIFWGARQAGSFNLVLEQGKQMQQNTATILTEDGAAYLEIQPLKDKNGSYRATDYRLVTRQNTIDEFGKWQPLPGLDNKVPIPPELYPGDENAQVDSKLNLRVQFRSTQDGNVITSSLIVPKKTEDADKGFGNTLWGYILWLTAMVGFWATMSLSIADITRYANTQREQVLGQFIGLPGTMILYSFVGIFLTFAAIVNFPDILVAEDAPWDPVSFLGKFDNPAVVIVAQVFMIIATLSTNIAANVIAPANAFSNLLPKHISFRTGGLITGIIGIAFCPWWLLDEISNILIFISGLLGPVLGILLCDYYVIRKKQLQLAELYKVDGKYSYQNGLNKAAYISFTAGVLIALVGYIIPALEFLYNLSWFTGFFTAFILYAALMKNHRIKRTT